MDLFSYEVVGKTSSKDKLPKRVLFCGTYPIGQSNGYSRVVYYIAKWLGTYSDIKLTIYGFQNYNLTEGSSSRMDLPSTVTLHDALATEDPKRSGFGEKEIADFLKKNPQDIVVIFNDMVVTSLLTQTIINELSPEERAQFKLVSYMDQVYPYQRPQFMDVLNKYFDGVIAFTPYWREVVRKLGLDPKIPCYTLPHGFDHKLYFPIPKHVARVMYNVPDNAFVILNLNRNQPRKRWDHCMMAYALVVKKCYDLYIQGKYTRPIRLMVGAMSSGCWELMEVFDYELRMLGVPIEFGRECVTALSKPQQISDQDINILYNVCDIGINTCEGEGFGLCQLEHAAVGCPQVAPSIGGLQDFLHTDHAMLIEAKWRYHIDKQRDGIGGVAEVGDPQDYAAAIWKYYCDPDLVTRHGKAARRYILQHYKWDVVVKNFHNILHSISAGSRTPACL